jgi:hypothetical protein
MKQFFSLMLVLVMMIGIITPGSATVVKAEDYDGYVYVTVERFTLGQGLAAEPQKIGYYEDENMANILKSAFGDALITNDSGYGLFVEGFKDGGEPTGWSTSSIPKMITDDLALQSIVISANADERRKDATVLLGGDYSGGWNSYWSICIDDVAATAGLSNITYKDNSDSSSFHNGSVLRLQYSIDSGNDLKAEKNEYNNPIQEADKYPDKDDLIRAIVDYKGDKDSTTYKNAIKTLEDWDATEAEVKAAQKSLSTQNIYNDALQSLINKTDSPKYGSEWAVFSIARAGKGDEEWKNKYIKSVEEKVEQLGTNVLKSNQSTENSKIIIVLNSVGADPKNVSGYNLIEPLADYDFVKKQGANGIIYALIALDSGNYDVPVLKGEGTQTTRKMLIEGILDAQIENGGWNYTTSSKNLDPDLSSMAICALAPYYKSNSKVKKEVDKVIDLLAEAQNAEGDFSSWGSANSCSCAQVVCALSSLGINCDTDKRFVKNGNSVLDAMLSYYDAENHGFKNSKINQKANAMATQQVLYSMAAFNLMKTSGDRLYMSKDHQHTCAVQNAKAATCTEGGHTGDKVCIVCGEVVEKSSEIAAKGHTPVEIPAIPATETTPGKTAGKKCSVCGAIIEEPKDIPATGKKQETTEAPKTVNKTYTVTSTSDDKKQTVAYTGNAKSSAKKITISATVKDSETKTTYKVTEVAEAACKNNKKVTTVTVGKNVTKIGAKAFAGCSKLSVIKVDGDTLKTIEKDAFKGIKKNATIIITASSKKQYKKVVKMFKKSGIKNVKFKFVKKSKKKATTKKK